MRDASRLDGSRGQFSLRQRDPFQMIRTVTHPAGVSAADTSAPGAPLLRMLSNATLLLAAFAAVCALLGALAPFPEVPGIFPKWDFFRRQRDRYDVLFIGSSRFYHQIIPGQFDAAAAAGGARVKSFNFGYDGMWPPESFYLLRRLLELKPARLKWVFIDLMAINTQLDERNNSTLRTAYWHDLAHTRIAFRHILETRRRADDKLALLAQHGRVCLAQLLNLGRGVDFFGQQLERPRPRKKPYSWETTAGFEAGPTRGLEGRTRDGYVATVERLKRDLPPMPVPPVFREALRELIDEVRRAGVEPIFVIAPTINRQENFTEIPSGAAVFALNRPAEYPELFNPDTHYDSWHLNEKGAVTFTAILADKFIQLTKVRP